MQRKGFSEVVCGVNSGPMISLLVAIGISTVLGALQSKMCIVHVVLPDAIEELVEQN